MFVLNSISFENFKCFGDFRIDFAPGFNIIIGKNGTGKTSAVKGIVKALSFMFATSSKLGASFISSGLRSLGVRSFTPGDFRVDGSHRKIADSCEIRAIAELDGSPIDWTLKKRSSSNSSLDWTCYEDAFRRLISKWDRNEKMPVLAFYSDSFPHSIPEKNDRTRHHFEVMKALVPQRNSGYMQWDDEKSSVQIWEQRACFVLNYLLTKKGMPASHNIPDSSLKDMKALEFIGREASLILEVLKEFSEALNGEFKVIGLVPSFNNDLKRPQLLLAMENNRLCALDELPAGYRRVFSIVIDIAYRSYLLNEEVNPTGIAIIDELDLHLHPELEQTVAQALTQVFPGMQFIATTHSPIIISNLSSKGIRENRVISLSERRNVFSSDTVSDVHGLDIESSLQDIMGVKLTRNECSSLADGIVMLEAGGFQANADSLRKTLLEKAGSSEVMERYLETARQNISEK